MTRERNNVSDAGHAIWGDEMEFPVNGLVLLFE